MTHGDDSGLVLPPAVAPIQVVIIPVQQHKEGVVEAATKIYDTLKAAGIRVKLDASEQSPGWKFSEYEMKGVPLRIEIGPRDIAESKCVIVRRDNREKSFVSTDNIVEEVKLGLDALLKAIYEKALANREERTFSATTMDELITIANENNGYIKAMWCGDRECEEKLKEVADVSSRCMPFAQEHISDTCVCCGRAAGKLVYWGKAY
jgi:prolyl-tRNA synthetase